MSFSDPYASLQSDAAHRAALQMAMASEPAQFIRSRIREAMIDLCEEGEPTTDYLRGYRIALRMAFLLAGGQCNGSEAEWAEIEQEPT